MLTFGTRPPKKCVSEPRALFSVSRSSIFIGIWFTSNHSANPTMTLVLPTPPLPPMDKMTRFSAIATVGESPAGSMPLCFVKVIHLMPPFLSAKTRRSWLQLAVDHCKLSKDRPQLRRFQCPCKQALQTLPFAEGERDCDFITTTPESEPRWPVSRGGLRVAKEVGTVPDPARLQASKHLGKLLNLWIRGEWIPHILRLHVEHDLEFAS